MGESSFVRSARSRRRWAGAGVLLALLVVLGCSSSDDADGGDGAATSGDGSVPTADEGSTMEVDELTETFVDSTRETDAGAETPAEPDRTVVVEAAFPTSGGPYPLVVLSHGLTGHPEEYAETRPLWAADGFVVVSPTFPLTNAEVPGAFDNVSDVVNQPGDVSFVIDEVLAANDDPSSPLHGLVDSDAIGVVGHSLGAATTWAVAYDTATRDDRVDSAVVFAGFALPMPGGELELDSGLPLLVLHGDADDVPIERDEALWQDAASPKWFVTLHGAEHVPAFTDAASPYDELVTETVLDFLHGTLDDDSEALARVTDDATDAELSTVQHE